MPGKRPGIETDAPTSRAREEAESPEIPRPPRNPRLPGDTGFGWTFSFLCFLTVAARYGITEWVLDAKKKPPTNVGGFGFQINWRQLALI